ncbi:hypothetical protein [Xanthomonas graminis]|uniref:hypothetical protein n=1 Tax=Xanthomonas graminis TaxID=3390026 RepID=UPI001F1FE2EC|nr:hypothetical protein [Xanthomonas translucens]UKE72356.1 hypothetical protein KFS85_15000 [Xanthomonas translucens pv. phleipratensis]
MQTLAAAKGRIMLNPPGSAALLLSARGSPRYATVRNRSPIVRTRWNPAAPRRWPCTRVAMALPR